MLSKKSRKAKIHSLREKSNELRQLKARINKLKNWLKDEATTPTDNLITVCMRILDGKENKSQYKKSADIKMYSKMVRFLQENNIKTIPELQNKASEIRGTYNGITGEIKGVERRLKVLSENIKYAENYQKYKKVYATYKQQKPKKQDAFYDSHTAEIILYEAAERYLKKNIGVNVAPPIKKWKAEVEKLTGEKNMLYWQFSQLKESVREVLNQNIHMYFPKGMKQKCGDFSEPVWYLFVLGFLSRFFVRQGVRLRNTFVFRLRTTQHGGKYAKKTGAKRYRTGSQEALL